MTSERCCRLGSHTQGPPPLILEDVVDEDEARHIEKEHHLPVTRENEGRLTAMLRFMRENPDAHLCPTCSLLALPWTFDVPPEDLKEDTKHPPPA